MIHPFPPHGGQLRDISERFGVPASELIDFSANINPEGPPPGVLRALRASLDTLSTLTQYPDLAETELKRSIARYAGASSCNIAVANGFVPLLEAVLHMLPVRRCLLPVPSFGEYRKALHRAKVEVTPHVLAPEANFRYNVETMVHCGQDAVLLANPLNPSGVLCDRTTMLHLISEASKRNIYLLLDEAFIDYAAEDTVTPDVYRFPNLIVFRSVTKFYGIPGLRVAYMVANPNVIYSINECLAPWPITSLASRAVVAALRDEAYAERTRSLNLRRMAHLVFHLNALGIDTYPSAANFLLLRLPAKYDAIALWERMILEHRIVLRSCANYEALPAGYLRIAVRGEADNARLLESIRLAL